MKQKAEGKISRMIEKTEAEWLYDNSYLEKPKNFSWQDEKIRLEVLEKFIELVRKNIIEIMNKDLDRNGLRGLKPYYKICPYDIFVVLGKAYSVKDVKEFAAKNEFPNDKIYPWEMVKVGGGFWKDERIKVAASKWLVWKIKKEPKELITKDFSENGLGSLLYDQYGGSPFKAFLEANLVTKEDEKYMRRFGNARFKTD